MAKKRRKKKQGFGASQDIPTREVKEFVLALSDKVERHSVESPQVARFVTAQVNHFGESLLDSLPLMFQREVTNASSEDAISMAALMGILSSFFCDFPQGQRGLNGELSLVMGELAFKGFRQDEYPQERAAARSLIASAYRGRIRGDRAENLEIALSIYQELLDELSPEDDLKSWASTQYDLANVYAQRLQGDRAENLETAIALNQEVAERYSRDRSPHEWGEARCDLAGFYLQRLKGDRAENLEIAIALNEEAVQVFSPWDFAFNWALVHQSFMSAYRDRIEGEPLQNLAIAFEHYELAAEIFNEDEFPYKWAENESLWAEVLMKRASLMGEVEELAEAIERLEDAIVVLGVDSPEVPDIQAKLEMALTQYEEMEAMTLDVEELENEY